MTENKTKISLPPKYTSFLQFDLWISGVAVRTTMDATITNQYCAVLSRLNDQVHIALFYKCIHLSIMVISQDNFNVDYLYLKYSAEQLFEIWIQPMTSPSSEWEQRRMSCLLLQVISWFIFHKKFLYKIDLKYINH